MEYHEEAGFFKRQAGRLTEPLALSRALVEENLGADDVSKGRKGRCQVGIRQIVRKVVDEQVCSWWT